MRGMTRGLLGALCVSLLFVNVVGAESPRPYARVSGLAVFPSDSDLNDPLLPSQTDVTLDLDGTFGVAGAVGMDWTHGWQTEVEVGYRSMDVSSIALTIPGIASESVDLEGLDWKTLTVMANVRYVLKPETVFNQSWGGIHPYVAGGGGIAFHEIKADGMTTDSYEVVEGSANDNVAAYQAMAGLSYDITADLSTHVGYRYVGTADFENGSSTLTYNTHGVEFGLAYLFF